MVLHRASIITIAYIVTILLTGSACYRPLMRGGALPRTSHDYALQRRVDYIGTRLVATAARSGVTADAHWHFSAYDAPGHGAVVSSDGSVVIEAGLARQLRDDELAALLAHEIAHVLLSSDDDITAFETMSTLIASGSTIAISAATGMPWWGWLLTWQGGEIVRWFPAAAYERSLEGAADARGLWLLCAAGYSGTAMVRALERTQTYFRDVHARDVDGGGVLSSHPAIRERIAHITITEPQYCRH